MTKLILVTIVAVVAAARHRSVAGTAVKQGAELVRERIRKVEVARMRIGRAEAEPQQRGLDLIICRDRAK